MKQKIFHSWNLKPKSAIDLQKTLAKMLSIKDKERFAPKLIGGVDLAFNKKAKTGIAALTVFSYPDIQLVDFYSLEQRVDYPYIPGLLSFREGKIICRILKKCRYDLDVLIFDGQGILHQRSLGIASHIGLLFDIPSIGAAKSRLVGEAEMPGNVKGSKSIVEFKGKKSGYLLRTRTNVKPMYISPGHNISLKSAAEIAVKSSIGFRLPEPTRIADKLCGKIKRNETI